MTYHAFAPQTAALHPSFNIHSLNRVFEGLTFENRLRQSAALFQQSGLAVLSSFGP